MRVEADWLITDDDMNKALGGAIRRAREKEGLTRPELVARLPFKIATATLLNWELGHRAVSYARLVEVARTLGTTASALVARAQSEVETLQTTLVEINVESIAADTRSPYAFLREWAVKKRAALGGKVTATVHHSVVRELAVLEDVNVNDLVSYLTTAAQLRQLHEPDLDSEEPAS